MPRRGPPDGAGTPPVDASTRLATARGLTFEELLESGVRGPHVGHEPTAECEDELARVLRLALAHVPEEAARPRHQQVALEHVQVVRDVGRVAHEELFGEEVSVGVLDEAVEEVADLVGAGPARDRLLGLADPRWGEVLSRGGVCGDFPAAGGAPGPAAGRFVGAADKRRRALTKA